jgi:O-acetylserine/cysteine efflux transporter
MDATPAVLLVQAEVIFGVIIAALLLGEKPSMRQVVGIAISCFGILTIVGAPSLKGQIFGVMLILGGTLAFALGQVLIRRLKGVLTGFQLTAWMGVMAGPQMILAAMLFEGDLVRQISTAPMVAWGTVLYLGLIMTVVGYSAWYFVLARYPVPMVMPVLLLLPVATILGAVSFLGERPDMIVLLGGAIVIAGVGAVIIDLSVFTKRQKPE